MKRGATPCINIRTCINTRTTLIFMVLCAGLLYWWLSLHEGQYTPLLSPTTQTDKKETLFLNISPHACTVLIPVTRGASVLVVQDGYCRSTVWRGVEGSLDHSKGPSGAGSYETELILGLLLCGKRVGFAVSTIFTASELSSGIPLIQSIGQVCTASTSARLWLCKWVD